MPSFIRSSVFFRQTPASEPPYSHEAGPSLESRGSYSPKKSLYSHEVSILLAKEIAKIPRRDMAISLASRKRQIPTKPALRGNMAFSLASKNRKIPTKPALRGNMAFSLASRKRKIPTKPALCGNMAFSLASRNRKIPTKTTLRGNMAFSL